MSEEKAFGIDQQGGKGNAGYTEDVMPTLCSDSHGTPHAVCYSFAPGMAMRYGGDNRFQEEVSPSVTAATGDNRLAVAFTQNTREEVRLIGGDGETVGALSAGGGMHQTNYVAIQEDAD